MFVSKINIYPIKSLRGISLKTSIVEDRGLEHDRRFMIVDANNELLTQREFSKMATISVEVTEDGLNISAEGICKLAIPNGFDGAEKAIVRVWQSYCEALVAADEINKWFCEVLNTTCRLVQMPSNSRRLINNLFNVNDDIVSFADGYPLLVIGESSLRDLNEKLEKSIPMNRFRPNLVVSGSETFGEDTWKKIRIGKTVFRAVKPCARCVVTTIDQETGVSNIKEPLKTLASYRKAEEVYPDSFSSFGLNNNDVIFGRNLVAENFGEYINIGDNVDVIA